MVFVMVDLNVSLDDNLNITDDTRICAAVCAIKQYLIGYGAKVILSSHMGYSCDLCSLKGLWLHFLLLLPSLAGFISMCMPFSNPVAHSSLHMTVMTFAFKVQENSKENEDWLAIVEEKRIEKLTVFRFVV
ncbi:hypothetical protein TSUD_393210 [Trifolium subterraneum]|uniref:phosphoglycerate kinase n=1 Tax=Trifolium subterraneum TaxID=3900 RepID=A0A2Z6N9H9_TRISU|nr:hypothetical protein TSUD_393210 [Trifolium subterraneum]